jgi:tetratricopeptide (TPR) repeat protein
VLLSEPDRLDAKKQLSDLYNQLGVEQAKAKNFEEAIFNIKKALEIDPENLNAKENLVEIYRDFGVSNLKQDSLEEGINILLECIKLQPDDHRTKISLINAYYNLGITKMQARDFSGAVLNLEKALEIDPSDRWVKENLSIAYRELGVGKANVGDLEGAVSYLTKALETLPKNAAHAKDGEIPDIMDAAFINASNFYAKEFLLINNDLCQIYYTMAKQYLNGERFIEAIITLTKLLNIDPNNKTAQDAFASANHALTKLLAGTYNIEDAKLKISKTQIEKIGTMQIQQASAMDLEVQERTAIVIQAGMAFDPIDGAIPEKEQCLGLSMIFGVLSAGLYSQKRYTEAVLTSKDAYILSKNDASKHNLIEVLSAVGYSLFNEEIFEAAKSLFQEALSLDPIQEKKSEINKALSMSYKILGAEQYSKGNIPESIAHLTKALECNPENVEAKKNLSALYTNTGIDKANAGDVVAGIEDLEKALEVDPTNQKAKGQLSIAYGSTGVDKANALDFLAATVDLKKALELDSENEHARKNLSVLYLDTE